MLNNVGRWFKSRDAKMHSPSSVESRFTRYRYVSLLKKKVNTSAYELATGADGTNPLCWWFRHGLATFIARTVSSEERKLRRYKKPIHLLNMLMIA